jgi:23S rRNA (cytosine1962-C5)-methyltransferase
VPHLHYANAVILVHEDMVNGKVILRKGREESVLRRHPWIFSGAISQADAHLADGDWVEVCRADGQVLGYGHFQRGTIAVRLLVWGTQPPDAGFWQERLQEAVAVRQAINLPAPGTNAFRLVHGEGDGLPGLVVDYYNGVAVMQAHSVGMHHHRQAIAEALRTVMGPTLQAVYYKSRGTLPQQLRTTVADEYLYGHAELPHCISENHCLFTVNWQDGQKTGFFLDQRDNRALTASLCKGRTVLNAFCYTGGFTVYALKAGALRADSIDASQRAIEMTRNNLALNHLDAHHNLCLTEDAFDYLEHSAGNYDLIILDPPAFAKHREAKHQAVKGYQRLNALALKGIRKGGLVVTFSCSQVIDPQLFYDTVVSAAVLAGRTIRVLHKLGQPADHPVAACHPEGEYLKGLVLHVS